MATQIVSYSLDDETVVQFEVEPTGDWHPVGTAEVVGRVGDAVGPAIEAARSVLNRVSGLRPDNVQVKFGVKVNGTANWIIAKAATEANFEITLTWDPQSPTGSGANSEPSGA
ncbi:CU044_2847 family protein [Streptomyces sp. NPDC001401]|uniref:CU044_2847 family protein n=1 Tax=Streptomyces sp. NPDC001401 TaxID=3364570 RepID=UPI0036C4BDF4